MGNIAPYQTIRLVMKAGMLECPCEVPICDMCMYHDFCSALSKAFTEARKLSETDITIKGILDEAYEQRPKDQVYLFYQAQEYRHKPL